MSINRLLDKFRPTQHEEDMTGHYYNTIINTLKGETPDLQDIPPSRLDWHGPGAVLELYEATVGNDRENLIRSMGQVLENADQHPVVAAQVLLLVNALDLTQIHSSVEALARMDIASDPLLQKEINNYFISRELQRRQS